MTLYSPDKEFDPCAATASIFLYAQASDVICLHHDTLAIDRRFELHQERILFLSVDNVSERGAGRLVVSYDAGQTAIVWDLFTGDEIARFASYEPIRVAAWMKNGNVAFGKPTAAEAKRWSLMCPRQFARECHLVRAFYIRAHLSPDHIRSHHSNCSSSRLPNICFGVSITRQFTAREATWLMCCQISEWVNITCRTATILHHPAHATYTSRSVTNHQPSLARILSKAEV